MIVEKVIVKDELKINKTLDDDVFYKFLIDCESNASVDIFLDFKKEYTSAQIYGVVLCQKKQVHNINIFICHNVSNCKSDVKVFTFVDGKNAKLNYDCDVRVRKFAKKIKTNQYNRNYLLSKDAQVVAKPKLVTETLSDATHKSVTIDLEKELLFCFQARGIHRKKVKQLFLDSYMKEFL